MRLELFHSSPKGVTRDIGVTFNLPYGFYFAVGRLDGGFDMRPSQWTKLWRNTGLNWQTHFGPFDLMWLKHG